MILGIWLALLGVLAAPNLIIARKPDAAQLIGRLAPYQGWIGAVSALCGVFGILSCVSHVGWLSSMPIFWLSRLADSVLLTSLGLLLGIGVFKTFIKNAQANEKLDRVIAKMAPYQGKLGLVAIALGVWMIIAGVMFPIVG